MEVGRINHSIKSLSIFLSPLLLPHCTQKKVIYLWFGKSPGQQNRSAKPLKQTSTTQLLRESKIKFSRENILSKMNKQNKIPIW